MFDVWKNVLAELEQSVPRNDLKVWFDGVKVVSVDDGKLLISTPNVFKAKMIESRYSDLVKEAFKHNDVEVKELEFVEPEKKGAKKRVQRSVSVGSIQVGSVAKNSTKVEKSTEPFRTGLMSDYSFDNFVVGENNEVAVGIAKNLVNDLGGRYNPFFLYGGPGLGKTHLVQAIGNELIRNNRELKLLYMPTSDFYSEFVRMIRANQGDKFGQKYRRLDVLILDDFQSIVGKEKSQAAFFDIFNDLYQRNKQIILTSDRLPEQIETLDPRLSSRLAWAGPIDIRMPSFEERCAILKAKAEFSGYDIDDEVIEYIADNVKTNVRELEGKLNGILAYAEIKGVSPSEVINSGLVGISPQDKKGAITSKQVISKVAKQAGITVAELTGKSRVANIKTARQVAMYLLSEELGMSTTKIASEVGVKDHTTVMHGIRKIREDLKLDFKLRELVEGARNAIYA